jgi:hypothetical protein
MKKLLIIFCLSFSISVHPQGISSPKFSTKDLIGTWQNKTSTITTTLKSNFRFSADGHFAYYTDGYNDLNPLKCIKGTYKLIDSSLYLKIISVEVVDSFQVIASEPSFQFGHFQISGGKIKTLINKDTSEERYIIKNCVSKQKEHQARNQTKEARFCMIIDLEEYYKISENPDYK